MMETELHIGRKNFTTMEIEVPPKQFLKKKASVAFKFRSEKL